MRIRSSCSRSIPSSQPPTGRLITNHLLKLDGAQNRTQCDVARTGTQRPSEAQMSLSNPSLGAREGEESAGAGRAMNSGTGRGGGGGSGGGGDVADLVCQLDCVQGMVDALSSVRWKRYQDAVVEISEHGVVVIVEETGCLQAKVYLKRELFLVYEYAAEGRPRFGLSLGLFVDCLNTFSTHGHAPVIEIRYPGPDMQLLLKSVDSPDACIYAEIRTRIPDTISWDYNFEPAGNVPITFTVRSGVLKEAIDDLDWPGSSIQINLQPDPPSVIFRGDGHGDLQIEFPYYANTDLLIAFQCDRAVSLRYKYKFLRATTSNIPSSVLKDNRGSKVTIGGGGMLKIQHLVSVRRSATQHPRASDASGLLQPSHIAYIEFFVRPEEEENPSSDS